VRYTKPILTAQKTKCNTITKTRDIFAVCTKHINVLCWRNAGVLFVKNLEVPKMTAGL
jgi:hypothetical protein